MRVLTLERITKDGKPFEGDLNEKRDWWCEIETKEEEMVYDDFLDHLGDYSGDARDILWNQLVIHAGQGMGVSWGDDDMYGYIMVDEETPEIGEEFVDSDGDRWIRIE